MLAVVMLWISGERFSLVWFTPLGIKVPEDLFWIDQASGDVKAQV